MAATKKLRAVGLDSSEVRDIIEHPQRIALVAQPVVDLRRGVIVGYETLSRFTLASGRAVFPEEVFSSAVHCGLGATLDAAVIQRALAFSRRRPPNCFLTINVDPLHLVVEETLDVISRHGDLSGIIFEITEHNEVEDLDALRSSLDVLRRHGAMIAIDDAGAGYSGLKQIVELRPQFIKVDRALVTGVQSNEAKRSLIQMLGELADRLDAWLIAEGIETDAELNALAQLGVPLGQGYLLARPAPPWTELSHDALFALATSSRRRAAALGAPLAKTGTRRRLPMVDHVVEPAVVCQTDEDWPLEQPVAVRVDATGRPIELRLSDEHGTRLRLEHDMLRVKGGTLLSEVARRAATRSDRLRWDPLLVVDDRGELEGVVPMARILTELADHTGKTASSPPEEPTLQFRQTLLRDPS